VVGLHLCALGAHVGFAARRGSLCEEAAKEAGEAGGTAVGLTCDVTDPASCEQVVRDSAEWLGGLDDVVYAPGMISIVALADADAEWWQRTFATNVMGASLVTRAALPWLLESRGTAVFLSSVASYTGPWPGLGLYASTKAALNRMIDTWRAEYPQLGFARIGVGPTASMPTTIAVHEGALPHQARWGALGLVSGEQSESESIARVVALILTDSSRVWDVTVQPRDGALPWAGVTVD
jgi:NAD(P)-dependent dehydrogenase (short-subunit alcohol dehydrogenase family)